VHYIALHNITFPYLTLHIEVVWGVNSPNSWTTRRWTLQVRGDKLLSQPVEEPADDLSTGAADHDMATMGFEPPYAGYKMILMDIYIYDYTYIYSWWLIAGVTT